MDLVNSLTSDITNNTLTNTINNMVNTGFSLDFTGGPEIETALAALMIGVGAALVFFGCRLFKATLFVLIMAGVTALVYYVGVASGEDSKVMFGVGLAVGFFCGMLAIWLWKVALFGVGALVGLVIFIILKNTYPTLFVSPYAEYAALILPMLILGVLSVCMERYWLLVATPILGSFALVQGIDHFANLDINIFGTLKGTAVCDTDECYGLWGGTIALAVVGMLVQYRWTAGFQHDKIVYKRERYVKQVDEV